MAATFDRVTPRIGDPVPRKEDRRLLTGAGSFSDDVNLDGQAYAVMVRSPHAHARITNIDVSDALASPGVLAAFTGADTLADGLGPVPHLVRLDARDHEVSQCAHRLQPDRLGLGSLEDQRHAGAIRELR